jgi:MFS family permease
MTTTVLTLTITGISADSSPAGGKGSHVGRRLVSVASMFTGGLAGAALVETGHGPWSLVAAAVLLGVIVAVTFRLKSSTHAWATPKP